MGLNFEGRPEAMAASTDLALRLNPGELPERLIPAASLQQLQQALLAAGAGVYGKAREW